MIKQVTLTQVSRFDKDPNGNPYVSSTGKPYVRMSIKAQEYGDQRISGFANAWNKDWKPGDEVTITITEKPNPKGGVYLNFDKADLTSQMLETQNNHERRIGAIESWIKRQAAPAQEPIKREDYPENEFPGDIPF